MEELLKRVRAVPGSIGFYYAALDGSERAVYNGELPVIAASVIKLPILVELFRRFECGELRPEMTYRLKDSDRMPSCGALNRMHAGLEVTLRDLAELMIILSDNTATNILIDLLGIESVNRMLDGLGMPVTRLRRRLFDEEASARGLQNTICASEIGRMLELLYRGALISPAADAEMIGILKEQRLNGKFPFYLESRDIECAHKTGEDAGTSHDAGIIYTRRPFVLCMFSNDTEVPPFERLMQDAAWELAQRNL